MGEPLVETPLGWWLIANGVDNAQAGAKSVYSGQYEQAYLESGLESRFGDRWGNGAYAVSQLAMPFALAKLNSSRYGRFVNVRSYDWAPVMAPYRGGYAYTGVPLPGVPQIKPVTFSAKPRTTESLVTWVDEGGSLRAGGHPGMRPNAYAYQAGAPGTRSNF